MDIAPPRRAVQGGKPASTLESAAVNRILLVEDDFDVAQNICDHFARAGDDVEWAPDGLIGLEAATREHHDLIVLDISLPRLSGIALCERLRGLGLSRIPILMLTASSDLENKLAAFDAGADDYLVKPFALQELESRLRALLRRIDDSRQGAVLQVSDLSFDVSTQTVRREGRALQVPVTGRRILELLMRNSHRVVSKDEIQRVVWGDDVPDSDALRAHIHTVREAIDKPFARRLLYTIRGYGYRLTAEETT